MGEDEKMNKEYITDYINRINETLGVYVSVSIEEAVLNRFALYDYCIGNKVYCWSELFEKLDQHTKELHIIHAYAILLDADISRRGAINADNSGKVQLLMNPDKLANVICKLMTVEFIGFEELQTTIIYNTKSKLFPFPNPRGTFFKIGDEIRSGITILKIKDIFYDKDKVMVTAQSLNSIHKVSRIITLPETEMMEYFRIVNPAEFQGK